MTTRHPRDLIEDLFLPTLFFAALGGMTWAVRGCSGYGGEDGCLFAGIGWSAAWWYMAHEPSRLQSRRYASGWVILAITVGVAMSGARGWMQWPSFFEGHLLTNYSNGSFVPIPRAYGFLWLFIAGVPWAGLGACMLAWCASGTRMRPIDWALRLAFGVGAVIVARTLFNHLPQVFLPLYESMKAQYADLPNNPNLRRLINDNRAAISHLGLYLGFLAYEVVRRDWKNSLLICTVGLVNGVGWASLQNWRWALRIWPDEHFNFWRCWESSGGISIGIAYGLAYFLVNRRQSPDRILNPALKSFGRMPNLERFAAYFALLLGLGLSIRNGLKGRANIYLGHEQYWSSVFWWIIGPALVIGLAVLATRIVAARVDADFPGDLFPNAHRLMWLVLIILNLLAQLVTGPRKVWSETAFAIYYVLLFLITAVIVVHEQRLKLSIRDHDASGADTAEFNPALLKT